MPATETVDGPPAGVNIVPSSRPSRPPPAPTREIKMSDVLRAPGPVLPATARAASPAPAAPARSATPPAPAAERPGAEPAATPPAKTTDTPAKARLHDALQTSADKAQESANAPRPGADTPSAPPEPAAEAAPVPTTKPGKLNPWKERDEWRNKAVVAEAEVQRLKSSVLPENDRTSLTERVTKAEARAAELENAIRFKDYEQSSEFIEKFHQPYIKSFQQAMSELGELKVTDPGTGQQRLVTGEDFARLANMGLRDAQAAATEMFGEFAAIAMEHRSQIRRVAAEREQAIADAKQNGALREQQTKEQRQRLNNELAGFTKTTFQKVNGAILADKEVGEFFTPRVPAEGLQPTPDEKEWNDRLAKGFDQVDRGWAQNPMNPNLSPEQRANIITTHAAIRNRSAAFGPMRWQIGQLRSKVKTLETELSKYRESTPIAGGSAPASIGGKPVSAHEGLYRALEESAMKRR